MADLSIGTKVDGAPQRTETPTNPTNNATGLTCDYILYLSLH